MDKEYLVQQLSEIAARYNVPADREAFAVSAEEAELIGADEVKLPGSFRYSGTPVVYHDLPEDLDVVAHQQGYATITPIHSDLTHYAMVDEIKGWNLG